MAHQWTPEYHLQLKNIPIKIGETNEMTITVPRRLFFGAQHRIAITSSPNYYKKMQRFTTRKNQEEHGPDVM